MDDLFLITNGLAKADSLTKRVHKLTIHADESGYIVSVPYLTCPEALYNRVVVFNNHNELIHNLVEYIHVLEDNKNE